LEENWPNFFIVGAAKAGTTSLYEYLRQVPGIYMSTVKEPNYFSHVSVSKSDPYRPVIRDKKKYLELFKNVKDEIAIGEASISYLHDPEAPKLIHEVLPDAKILISLRDPVERFFSWFLMRDRLGRIPYSFHEIIEIIHKTGALPTKISIHNYYQPVKRYLETFGENQVKIIIFEEWTKDLQKTILEITKFLGINFTDTISYNSKHNPYVVARNSLAKFIFQNPKITKIAKKVLDPKSRTFLKNTVLSKPNPKPVMGPKEKEILVEYFQEDIKNIETLLGRKLPWHNFKN